MKKKGGKYLEFSIFERKVLLFLIDNIIIFLCVSSLLDNGEPFIEKIHYIKEISPYLYSIVLFIVLSPFVGFYDIDISFKVKKIIPISMILGLVFSLIFLFTPFIVPRLGFSKSEIIYFILSVIFGLMIWRVFFAKIISNPNFYKNILLITENNYPYSYKRGREINGRR